MILKIESMRHSKTGIRLRVIRIELDRMIVQECVVARAVEYEPVSSLIFPVFREITGKISKNADENRILRGFRSENSIVCGAFP